MIDKDYYLDVIPAGQILTVHASQYDEGRTIVLHLYRDNVSYSPGAGATASIDGTKPDNKGFSLPATISGDTVTFDTTRNMCAVPGDTVCEIRIMKDGDNIGSANFILHVERAGLADDIDISETEIPVYVDAARENAETAEAYAVGTRNGEAVSSDDPAYHNNSLYHSQQASGYASAASGYASNASGYADNAAGSAGDSEAYAKGTRNGTAVPSTDPAYHNNSKHYSEQAAQSAQEAAASVASGTQVRFYIQDGYLYVVQTIGGVEQQPVNLGAVEGAAVQTFATVAAMNTAITGGTVAEGALCCVQQNIVMADTTSY